MAGLRRYLTVRLIYLAITFFIVISFNFFLFHVLPGDPARLLVPRGGVGGGDVDLRAQIMKDWGLDRPLHEQYLIYLGQTFQGDLGISMTYLPWEPVEGIILRALPLTLLLAGAGTLVSIWIGFRLGVVSAVRLGRPSDAAITLSSLVFYSVPTFVLAILLLTFFTSSRYLGIFPIQGYQDPLPPPPWTIAWLVDILMHAALPLSVYVLGYFAEFALIMRNSLVDVYTEDFILTARAKGLSPREVLRRHAVPNARLPLVTVIAFNIGWILSGDIVIQEIFRYPGLGYTTWEAVSMRDYTLLQGVFLVSAAVMLVANFSADVAYSYLDPRVRR